MARLRPDGSGVTSSCASERECGGGHQGGEANPVEQDRRPEALRALTRHARGQREDEGPDDGGALRRQRPYALRMRPYRGEFRASE